MAIESQTYSGVCKYSDIDFTFVYIDNELRLIPPADKRAQIRKARIRKYTENGAYTTDKLLTMDEPVLTGHCYETGANIFFITKQGGYISSCDSVLFVPIVAYILCRYNLDTIARMSFSGPVIDCIYPVNQGIKFSMNAENFFETGVFTATTQSYGDTTTDPQSFTVDDKRLSVKFGISRGLSTKLNVSPITLSSSMYFEFEPTKDYRFIFRLWRIAKQFIQYLCYRKNISLSKVELSSIAEDGRYERFATLHVFDETGDDEPEILQSGRYIKQIFLAGAEGKILTDIADGTLYLRHLPQSYRNGRSIDASRFVMITAAFEWEFHRSFPVGITKSEATLNAEETVSRKIQELYDHAGNSKQRKLYRFLQRLVRSDSLQSEIVHTEKVIDDIVGIFGKHLYHVNGQQLEYSEMGGRLSNQRNNFAHGNLDKEFIGLSLLDLMYMEYILYAMQLKYYGVDKTNIRRAINDLFHLNNIIE